VASVCSRDIATMRPSTGRAAPGAPRWRREVTRDSTKGAEKLRHRWRSRRVGPIRNIYDLQGRWSGWKNLAVQSWGVRQIVDRARPRVETSRKQLPGRIWTRRRRPAWDACTTATVTVFVKINNEVLAGG